MTKLVDITGLKFGKLLVLGKTDLRSNTGQIFWKCLCDCGNETRALSTSLKTGNTSSCGCWKILVNNKYDPKISTARRAFKNYRLNGDLIPISISFEKFYELSQLNCYYCNEAPSNLMRSENRSLWHKENGNFIYNGLDRIDSNKNYDIDNIVTCCKYCNKSKCALSIEEFKSHIKNMIYARKTLHNNNFENIKPITIENIDLPLNRSEDFLKPFKGKIIPGLVIGKWKVIKKLPKYKCLCKCECGISKKITIFNLKAGKSRSCGNPLCYQEYPSNIYKAKAIWISRYKDGDLSFKDFYYLSQNSCIYCGVKFSQIITTKDSKKFIYNGLDRINTSLPHNKNNVVPCCYTCNKIKNDRSLSQLNKWLTNIFNHWLN